MSRPDSRRVSVALGEAAPIFAALGEKTRLQIVAQLCAGGPASIASLTAGTAVTRQAVTKHLRILAAVGLVRVLRAGRESSWELEPQKLAAARLGLELISQQWDATLERLREFVEEEA